MRIYLLLLSSLTGLTGTVLDEKNRPVEGAVVVLITSSFRDEPKTAAADANGRYEIAVSGHGPFRVEAYAPGTARVEMVLAQAASNLSKK